MQNIINDLKTLGFQFKDDEPLSRYTTFRIGGPAKIFVSADSSQSLHQILELAIKYKIPYFVLGKGSNILVSDKGYNGLVIFNNATTWKIIKDNQNYKSDTLHIEQRFESLKNSVFSTNENLKKSRVLVEVESGAIVGQLMKQLFKEDVSGLEWFSGIPSTVGGAIYMNMHGADHFFGELVKNAIISDGKTMREVDRDYFKFDYDWSILHQTRETVIKAKLVLFKGLAETARENAKKWALHKSNQPWRSAGCIFQNLTDEQKIEAGIDSVSVGYIVDKILNLKGKRIGDAVISENHAAFIENIGNAKATEVFELINLIKDKAQKELGIALKMEVQLIGDFN